MSDKQATVLDPVAHDLGPAPRQYERVLGLDYPLNQAVHQQFVSDFRSIGLPAGGDGMAGADSTVSPGLDRVHDCTYLAAYAAIAAQIRFSLSPRELSAAAVLVGLRALSGGGVPLSVGSTDISAVYENLAATRGADASVNLSGGYGALDLLGLSSVDQLIQSATGIYVRPRAHSLELYCIDAPKTQFCDTGRSFSLSDGSQFIEEGGCPCFSNH